jgi:hypothetical protein
VKSEFTKGKKELKQMAGFLTGTAEEVKKIEAVNMK